MKTRFYLCASLAAALCCFALSATAAEPPADAPADVTASGLAQQARTEDASIDRGILSQHAETIGAGQVSINSYELLLAGVTYGFTDNVQASISVLLPITSSFPLAIALNGKFVVYRSAQTVLAVDGNFDYGSVTSNSIFYDGSQLSSRSVTERAFLFGGGLSVDHHVVQAFSLHSSLQLYGVGGQFDKSGIALGNGAAITLTGGFTIRANHFFKILAEVLLPAAISSQSGFQTGNGALACYGVRFYGHTVAADLSFIRPFGGNGVDTGLALGVPFVTFNARF